MCKFCVGGCGLLIKDPPSNATVRVKIISLNGSLEALPARWRTEDHRAVSIAKYSGHSWPGQSDWGQECPQYGQKLCRHERQGSILHRLNGATINALRD